MISWTGLVWFAASDTTWDTCNQLSMASDQCRQSGAREGLIPDKLKHGLIFIRPISGICKQQARKAPSYASSKLRPTGSLTEVKCRATSVAKKFHLANSKNYWCDPGGWGILTEDSYMAFLLQLVFLAFQAFGSFNSVIHILLLYFHLWQHAFH